jgi:hypothetical protein
MIPPLLAEARGHLDKPEAGELFAQGLWLELEKLRDGTVNGHAPRDRASPAEIKREAVRAPIAAHAHGYPPSEWLCILIGDVLGFFKKPRDQIAQAAFNKATVAKLKDPSLGVRELARLAGVSPSTVWSWKQDELWQQLGIQFAGRASPCSAKNVR